MKDTIIAIRFKPAYPTKRFANTTLAEVCQTLIAHCFTVEELNKMSLREIIREYRRLYFEGLKQNDTNR